MLLRAAAGITAGTEGVLYFVGVDSPSLVSATLGAVLIATGATILAGLFTPMSNALAAASIAGVSMGWLPAPHPNLMDPKLPAILTMCVTIALVLLGPGALSLDAKIFGRREIIIPPRP